MAAEVPSTPRVRRWLFCFAAVTASVAFPSGAAGHDLPLASDTPNSNSVRAQALWYDGTSMMLAGVHRQVLFFARGEPVRAEDSKLAEVRDIAGSRAIPGGMAVLVDATRASRYVDGSWEHVEVPLLDGDELIAVAVDATGRTYCVGSERAIYVWHRDTWRTHEYPNKTQALAAATTPGGQLFVVGRRGSILRYTEGEGDFEPVILPGMSADALASPWHAAWYGSASKTLWVRAGADHLLEIDIVRGTVIEHHIPEIDGLAASETSSFGILDGYHHDDHDKVVMVMGRSVYLFEGERFVHLGNVSNTALDLAVIGYESSAYVATEAGIEPISIRPGERINRPRPLQADERDLLEDSERWQGKVAKLRKNRPLFWLPTVRIAPGISLPLDAEPALDGYMETGAGAIVAPIKERTKGPTLWIWPEASYRFEGHQERGGHAFDFGVGVGWGTHMLTGYYRPALVLKQRQRGGPKAGLQHTMSAQLLWGLVGIDATYEAIATQTALRFGVSFNIVPWLWLAIL